MKEVILRVPGVEAVTYEEIYIFSACDNRGDKWKS